MENLTQEIKSTKRTRLLIDIVGIILGVLSFAVPVFYGNLVTTTVLTSVTLTLLPVAVNYMVLSIALRLRTRDLSKMVSAQSTDLLPAYLSKIAKHKTVLVTIGWVLTVKAVYDVLGPFFNIVRLSNFDPTYADEVQATMVVSIVASGVQGVLFAAAQFSLARFLKNQGLRLAPKQA